MSSSVGITQNFVFEDLTCRAENFLRAYYLKDIRRLARGYPEEKSLYVDYNDLDKYDIKLADEVISNPDNAIQAFERAIRNIELPVDLPSWRVNVRFENLPNALKIPIRDLSVEHIGKLVAFEGIVINRTDTKPKLILGTFECQQCGGVTRISQDTQELKEPFICEDCKRRSRFKLLAQESTFVDAQKILVSELWDTLQGDKKPEHMVVQLEDDLCKKVRIGGRVEIIGTYHAIKKRGRNARSRVFEVYVDANNVIKQETTFEELVITKEDEKKIIELSKDPDLYQKLIQSIVPSIEGNERAKEGLLLQMFSSPPVEAPDGTRIRGDIHILLMGEPATGRTNLLLGCTRLVPNGQYTNSFTPGGLTAVVTKDNQLGDDGEWVIQPGLLVLASGGVAYVDEVDKVPKEDIVKLHGAMEQQRIDIAKAGLNATLPTRCGITMACNPKFYRIDDYRSLVEQVNLPSTIMSRFDLWFLVRDKPEESRAVAKKILAVDSGCSDEITPEIPHDLLRKYIAYARQNIHPRISKSLYEKIEKFYVDLRDLASKSNDIPLPLTARQLWAMLRLTKARARARLSQEANEQDWEDAKALLIESLRQFGVDFETGRIDIDKIMVGVSKSQRDRITAVLDIIAEIEKEYGNAKKSEIIEMASEQGITAKQAEEALEKLKSDGHIYEPWQDERYKIS
jgi:replicative DNA helicase Mcm